MEGSRVETRASRIAAFVLASSMSNKGGWATPVHFLSFFKRQKILIDICTVYFKVVYTRGVNRAEISGPARKIVFSARPGPQSMYFKKIFYCTILFELLQQNQYNYIKLHSYYPLVQLLYCPSATVIYNVTVVPIATKIWRKI